MAARWFEDGRGLLRSDEWRLDGGRVFRSEIWYGM